MAHFAKIDNLGIVVAVETGDDNITELKLSAESGLTYRQTSYNTRNGVHVLGGTPFRKNYAGIGYTYDSTKDAFYPPKPFASWTLDASTCQWKAPTDMPSDGKDYNWNEDTTSWKEVT